MRLVLTALIALWPALAAGGPPPEVVVGALVLPSRRPDQPALQRRVEAVASALARDLGGRLYRAPQRPDDISPALLAAAQLQASGALDEAADSFDLALDRSARAPHLVRRPAELVSAHVARAAIALARGENDVGDELLARALRYDPTLVLERHEDSPTMRVAFDRVRVRSGAPAVEPGDLGVACTELGDVVVVARFVEAGAEFRRIDECRVVTTVVATRGQTPAEIARVLAGLQVVRRAPPPPDQQRSPGSRRFYQRTWFWLAIGGAAAISAGATLWLTRDDDRDQLDITTRF